MVRLRALPLIAAGVLTSCRAAGPTVVNDVPLADETNGDDWLAFGRN